MSDHGTRTRRLALLVSGALLLASAPALAGSSPLGFLVQDDEGRVVQSGDKVRIGSGVTVEEDEVVMGDVVSILGSARVDGQVTGDVVVVLGDLTLGSSARVNNVTVVGGELRRRRGARVRGDLNEIGIGRLRPNWGDWGDWDDWGGRNPFRRGFGDGSGIGWTLFRLLFLAGLVMAVVFVAPATVRKVGQQALGAPWTAGLIGLAIQIFFVPVLIVTAILLAISIIGIPLLLLLPFVVLGLIIVALVGFSGVAYEIGHWLKTRGGAEAGSMFVAALVGVFVIVAVALAGRGVALGGGLFSLFAAILLACAFLIEYAAWTIGIGATTLAAFSGRRYTTPPPSTGAAPIEPPPSAPPSAPAPPTAPPPTPPARAHPPMGDTGAASSPSTEGQPAREPSDLRIVERESPPAAPLPPAEPPRDEPT